MGQIVLAGSIPALTRDLMLMVIDGCPRAIPWMHMVWKLEFFRLNEILAWLVKNKITGTEFVAFIEQGHERSVLGMLSYILMQVNRDLIVKPIIVGEDLR